MLSAVCVHVLTTLAEEKFVTISLFTFRWRATTQKQHCHSYAGTQLRFVSSAYPGNVVMVT